MMLKWPPLILFLFFSTCTASAQVLMEVPLLLELPGRQELIRAWYDGKDFFVDGKELFQFLEFTVQINGATLEALDTHHHHRFSCTGLPQNHSCKIHITDVLDRLGSALHFDQNRLHLSASSVAASFDIDALRERQRSWAEVPGPHLFGRTRQFWGGAMMNWQLRRDVFGVRPSLQITSNALLGSIEADLENGTAWVYRSDWPRGAWLTQVEIGRTVYGDAGILVTNTPLARQRLQRIRAIHGQSTPHALVQAVISGEIIDQVQADTEGKYKLNVPVWYGTTTLEVYTRPLGGGRTVSDFQYLFTPASLVPPGKLYYQLKVREQDHDLNLQYGLHKRLSLRSSLTHAYRRMNMMVGLTLNPIPFLSLDAEVHLPFSRWQSTLQIWRSRVQINAHIHAQSHESLNMSLTASVDREPFSIWLRSSYTTVANQYQHLSVRPEIWLHHSGGFLMQANLEIDQLHGPSVERNLQPYWRLAAGWSFTQMRFLAYADHGYIHRVYGLEGILTRRHQSLTFSMGWDAKYQNVVGSLSIHISSALGNLFARGRRDHRGITHSQQVQGSIHLWRGIQLASSGYQKSAAEIQIFEDINGNGVRDTQEPILPHIEAQLYQGGWVRLKTGALYAPHLEPYQRYQIRILEASIHDPSLHPGTGFDFSFTADPGRRKLIQVPMQRFITIRGKVINLDRAPLRLRIFLNQEKTSEVYRDGGFTFHVHPGTYTLTVMDVLDQNVLTEKIIEVDADPVSVTINLDEERQ